MVLINGLVEEGNVECVCVLFLNRPTGLKRAGGILSNASSGRAIINVNVILLIASYLLTS